VAAPTGAAYPPGHVRQKRLEIGRFHVPLAGPQQCDEPTARLGLVDAELRISFLINSSIDPPVSPARSILLPADPSKPARIAGFESCFPNERDVLDGNVGLARLDRHLVDWKFLRIESLR
jgi:hypothetical protein